MSEALISTSPANSEDILGSFEIAGANDVDAAVARARSALPAWRDLGFEGRAAILHRFRDAASASAALATSAAFTAVSSIPMHARTCSLRAEADPVTQW